MESRSLSGALAALVLAGFGVFACTGDSPAAPGSGGDGGPGGSSGGSSGGASDGGGGEAGPVMAPPRQGAAGLEFFDSDLRKGFLADDIVVRPSTDETDITEYRVYFGSSATAKLLMTPIGAVAAKGVDGRIPFPPDTPAPATATHLLVYAANALGEIATPTAVPLLDNHIQAKSLLAGGAPILLEEPSVAFDRLNGRVLIAGAGSGTKARLVVCDPALDACEDKDASAGRPDISARSVQLLIDEENRKAVIVRREFVPDSNTAPAVTRCDLDGTNCVATDLRLGQAGNAAADIGAVLDPVGKRVYIVTANEAAGGHVGLVRCNLAFTDCVYKDTTPGAAELVSGWPNIGVDRAAGKIAIVSRDQTERIIHLTRCNLDGDACSTIDANAGQPASSGLFPVALHDPATGHLLTVARNGANGDRPSLFRCAVGSGICGHVDISAGQPAQSTTAQAAMALFPARSSFFFTTYNSGSGSAFKLSLFRCHTDGTGCSHRPLTTAGAWNNHMAMTIDGDTSSLYVVARENTTGGLVGFHARPW